CSATINSNAQVTINSNHTLILNDAITVNSGSLLTIENNGALRQVNDLANSGNIIVKRNSTPMVRLDYTAWSSPVENQQLQAFSPNTLSNRFYEYLYTGTTTATAYQTVNSSNNFESGKGYLIRVANNWSTSTPTTYNGQFNGVPANGTMNIPVGIGYNLLGNPYPSPISGNSFLGQNPSINTLYFWTHTAAASGGTYPANNFASYTTLGGTASAAGGSIPNGIINTGQGFYINKSTAGNALFKNNQRVNAATSSQFFRTTEEPETHRFWLNLNDDTTNYNQILIGYTENATNGIDAQIDGEILDKNQSYLFNIINDDEYVIQGRGLPFLDEDIVPLGIEIKSSGNYSIAFENADGLFSNHEIYLKDNQTNTIHDIKENPYTFYSAAGNTKNRFEIVYKNSVLGNEDFELNQLQVYSANEIISVASKNETIKEIIIFDIVGRMLFHKKNINSNTFEIRSLTTQNQALLVKVISSSNKEKIVKVIH
ncbi:MAG: T9SS sorting signal type C domain-containing protein, partial [Flavobacterium sp.]